MPLLLERKCRGSATMTNLLKKTTMGDLLYQYFEKSPWERYFGQSFEKVACETCAMLCPANVNMLRPDRFPSE